MFGIWSRRKVSLSDYWFVMLDNFETSTPEFYAAIKESILKRKIPGVEITTVDFPEGGALSEDRSYLRIRRERLIFDVCSAPFGTSWFFSCRFAEIPMRLRWWESLIILSLVAGFFMLSIEIFGITWGCVISALNLLGGLFLLNNLVALGLHDLDSVLLKIPVLGAFYETYLRRPSYYRDDTRRMYSTAVDRLVRTAVEKFADVEPGNAIDFKHDLVPTGLGFWGRIRGIFNARWPIMKNG